MNLSKLRKILLNPLIKSNLLAKIKNWRLVTNFVPASSLTAEKFKNIIPLDEEEDDDVPKESEKEPENEGEKKKGYNKNKFT